MTKTCLIHDKLLALNTMKNYRAPKLDHNNNDENMYNSLPIFGIECREELT